MLNRFKRTVGFQTESVQKELLMIPASYLFKDLYQQHWEEDTSTPAPIEHTRFNDGLTTPIHHLFTAIVRRRDKAGRRYFGVHAYD
jgi:hypothetical protein